MQETQKKLVFIIIKTGFAAHNLYSLLFLQVNPHNITIYDFTRAKLHKTMILDATDNPRLLQFNGAKLEVFKISKMHSFVNISIHGLATFSVRKTLRCRIEPDNIEICSH